MKSLPVQSNFKKNPVSQWVKCILSDRSNDTDIDMSNFNLMDSICLQLELDKRHSMNSIDINKSLYHKYQAS